MCIVGTSLQKRNPYNSKSGQTVSLFVGQILTSEALSQISMGWQGRYLLIKSNSVLSVVMQKLPRFLHENTGPLLCSGWTTASLTPFPASSDCAVEFWPVLSCIGQFFIQIKTVIINVHVLLLLACLITSEVQEFGICYASVQTVLGHSCH